MRISHQFLLGGAAALALALSSASRAQVPQRPMNTDPNRPSTPDRTTPNPDPNRPSTPDRTTINPDPNRPSTPPNTWRGVPGFDPQGNHSFGGNQQSSGQQARDPWMGYSGLGAYGHASAGYGGGSMYGPIVDPGPRYVRAFADVVRSAGDYNLKSSIGLNYLEEARRDYIQNRLLATEAWFERKELNEYYRAQMRRPPPTAEEAAQIAAARAPEKLEYRQLDPVTGEIVWPMLLQEETFERARRYLDHVFAENAERGTWSAEQQVHALNAARVMMRQLQSMVKDVPTEQYVPARNFLESLEYEVRLKAS